MNRRSILENDQMTRVGRELSFTALEHAHTTFKQVLNYVTANSISHNLPDMGPLVIGGLPRTDSTFYLPVIRIVVLHC